MLLIIMKRKGTGAQTIPNSESFENQFSGILERVLDFNLIYLLKPIDLFCFAEMTEPRKRLPKF